MTLSIRWLKISALLAGLGLVTLVCVCVRRRAAAGAKPSAEAAAIGCIGRIEPDQGVIRVSAPYFTGRPSLVGELKVKEGDWMQAGQIVAVLQSAPQLNAALQQSEAHVALARSRADNAQDEYVRYTKLYETKDVSSSELDERRLAAQTTQAALRAAVADAAYARAESQSSVIRAPTGGRVLKIHARPGETVGTEGLLELGDTTRMVVMAEVYETDIGRVKVGQQATISGDILPQPLQGVVERVGSQVIRNAVLPTDPVAFSDARVIQVKIGMADSRPLANLVYGKASVVIQP